MTFKRNKFLTNNIMARGLSGYCLSTLAIDQYSRNKLLHFTKLESLPNGTRPPNSFLIAQVNGAMASRGDISRLDVLSNLAGGRNLEFTADGVLTTNNPYLDRIINMILSTSGAISTDATLSAALLLLASSSGQITADALLGAIFSVTAANNCSMSYDVFLSAIGNISAEAGGPTPLSPEGLANAVWSALATDYTTVNTMGQKLNTASSGGVDLEALAQAVWDKLALDATSPDSMGELVNNISIELQKKLNTGTFIALK